MPTLNLSEAVLDPNSPPCSRFNRYFDFPAANGVSGLVLDLRGNQGGSLEVAVCLASELLKPSLPLFRIATRHVIESSESQRVGPGAAAALPVAIFIDKETDSGALALAAALQDQQRAQIIGEQKDKINGAVTTLVHAPRSQDVRHLGGQQLAAGVRVDVTVSTKDDDALMNAARAQFAAAPQGKH